MLSGQWLFLFLSSKLSLCEVFLSKINIFAKSSKFDLLVPSTTSLIFKFFFLLAVENNCCCFIYLVVTDNVYFYFMRIFIEHTKEKKKETDSEIMNLKKKDHSILKINGVNTPILNWQLFSKLFINFFLFCKSDMDMIKYTQQNTSQSYGKCWVLLKALLNV